MSKYKLAAFDMDGTFLDSHKEIRPSTADACKRASAAGKILAIDTGRAVSELTLYPFGEMGIRYGACTCGTVIYDFEQGPRRVHPDSGGGLREGGPDAPGHGERHLLCGSR